MEKRIWLITGISSGLGKALAERIMDSGDLVLGTFRKENQVNEFNKANQGRGHAYLLDVTDHLAIENVVVAIKNVYNKVDVLVNNAGIGFIGAIEESSMEEVRQVFEANFFGVLKLTQEILPLMREHKAGHIVQISSHGGLKAFGGFGIYNASKFALEGFSEALAQEVAPLGIKVSLVEPGPFRTQFAGSGLLEAKRTIPDYNETAGAFRAKLKGVDGKQEGDPAKAAEAILQLVNDETPSFRLPLGKTALLTIEMKLDSVRDDLERNRSIAENAVFI
ncbi:oxidoreductase [Flagellimonas allohymeniacidonis]|uniref:SDR family NAD(P)-dependent oxidoreductase n=1 Tax=Flagellimonas allohymeniacidonis TaxID=2517819 RepID=A0A4Q8QHM1_9FLAO|nr:oxidoreductase [Allomuricauda hymeniacidonis]TAI47939.1 SDR family NAD(P)-dependent oxidoreductase [Allomuricauda hymeniacidonis]